MHLEQGQVAVVTGGASGIGFALAEEFAKRGLDVVIADLDEPALAEAEGRLAEHGVGVLSLRVDVTDEVLIQDLARRTLERFGHVDVICNNAGTVGLCMPLWEFETVDWEWILAVDLWGVIYGIRAFVPHLVAQGHGYVVNTASMAGLGLVPLNAPYNAAKHAVVSISETLWADLQQHAPGVGVTVLCPGPTLTRLMTEGGRFRPARLAPTRTAGIPPQLNPGTFASSAGAMFTAEEMAEATIEAIGRNQLYLAPHPGAMERLDARLDRLRADVAALTMEPSVRVKSEDVFKS
jgi:NAD(P)-dependent dehydrogenase (short-subunit alcohol dehydrogenase family)